MCYLSTWNVKEKASRGSWLLALIGGLGFRVTRNGVHGVLNGARMASILERDPDMCRPPQPLNTRNLDNHNQPGQQMEGILLTEFMV